MSPQHQRLPSLLTAVIALTTLVLAASGCSRAADALLDRAALSTPAPAFDPDLGVDAALDALPQALAALRPAVGAEIFGLVDATILPGGLITFQVRDPDQPDNIDQYRWTRRGLEDPVPVRVVGNGDLDASTFRIDQLTPAGARGGYDAAVALDLEDGEVTVISLSVTSHDGLAWTTNVAGSRDSAVVITDLDGTLLRSV